ncbi:MAG: response regulator [Acidobacteriota bacterium]
MKDIRQKLLATFQIEHRDHVEQIRSLLAMIEKTGGQPQGPDLDEAFRRAHSLKGAARAVDLHPVEGLAHRLETLLSRVRQGSLPLGKEVTSVVQQALDASEDCVMALGDHRPTPGFQPALQALEKVLGMESESLEPVMFEATPEAPVATFQPLDMVRITTQNFDGLLRSAGGFLGETQRQTQLAEQLHALTQHVTSMEKAIESALRQHPATSNPAHSLHAYLDSSKRQVHALAGRARSVRRLHQRSAWAINRLGKQLQLDVWRARMVPSESLLEGYRKMMRDLARDEAKDFEFRAISTGVHADRRVLEALKDPLLHLLRNAVSHGMETPRERIAKGKTPAGMVSLRIESLGQQLKITIEDDGRGVNLARTAELATQQGILSEDEAASCTSERLTSILFQTGFSTTPAVTNLSGRGMGLSVVYETIRRLQGSVELLPREGGGTTIQLLVPLSIATHKLLLVNCGGYPFAFSLHAIERLHRIRLKSITTLEGRPVVLLNGRSVPIVSLHQTLELSTASAAAPNGSETGVAPVVVLRLKRGLMAVAVDGFLWENDAIIQDLGSAAQKGISGAVLLDNGEIAMVLNPEELFHVSAQRQAFPMPTKPVRVKRPTILVVDDSMTTRTLEKSILEAHGYLVRVAVDGMDALACLRKETADLVISDVQMPRLDGFGLLETMKGDPELNKIPVIVVTSLGRREDQERGLRLGADAYIVKGKFDQGELLATIRQIL